MEEEQQQLADDDVKFLMKTGGELKTVIIKSLRKKYSDKPLKMKRMFMLVLSNSMANILNDVSNDENAFQTNLNLLIESLNNFKTMNDLTPVTYNPVTEQLTRQTQ